MIEEMLAYNRTFVENQEYRKYTTSKYPNKKIAILTCMDTRLVELLPAALGIRNGDVKMIKNAGGMITGPFDSTVRSLLVPRLVGSRSGVPPLIILTGMYAGSRAAGVAGMVLAPLLLILLKETHDSGLLRLWGG